MSSSTITEAKEKMQSLIDVQAKVDAGIAKMKDGPEKQRLMKMREENRSWFSTYVLPAWKKLQTYLNESEDPPKAGEKSWYNPVSWFAGNDEGMGVLPLIPIAAVAAATALLGYVANSIVVENRILSDPSFTAAQKTDLLKSGSVSNIVGSVGNAFGQLKWVAILGLAGFLAYTFKDQIKTRSNPRRKRKKNRRG